MFSFCISCAQSRSVFTRTAHAFSSSTSSAFSQDENHPKTAYNPKINKLFILIYLFCVFLLSCFFVLFQIGRVKLVSLMCVCVCVCALGGVWSISFAQFKTANAKSVGETLRHRKNACNYFIRSTWNRR